MNTPLHTERRGGAAKLILNRPARRNALSRELIGALAEELRKAEADPDVRSILLTGAPPAFCAGLDLNEVAAAGRTADQHDASALLALYELIDNLPKPVIAAVNGPAVAGGAALVCACDLALFAESAQIGYPGVRHGLVAPLVMPSLLRLVGERRARYLLLTGEMIAARQAAEYGLANEVVPDRDLLARARYYADLFRSCPPAAVAQTKAILARLRNLHGDEAVAEARRSSAAVPLTDESRAGVQRFLDSGA
jgi:methylglutaconyl-CoA hydratase